jgi:hypothetical protein
MGLCILTLTLILSVTFTPLADASTDKSKIIVLIQKSILGEDGERLETICKFDGALNFYDGRTAFPRITEADVKTFKCNHIDQGLNLEITFGAFAGIINSKFVDSIVPPDVFGSLMLKAVFPLLLIKNVDDESDFQPGISTVFGSADLRTTSLFGALSPELSVTCDIERTNCESSQTFYIKASFLVTEL